MTVKDWIDELDRDIRVTFSLEDAYSQFPNLRQEVVRNALFRLVQKRRIVSVWQGFYIILNAHYAAKGMLPATFYIDQLMAYLKKDYYVALLNAAEFWGAAHQRPQTFSVITPLPYLRGKLKKGVQIDFLNKSNFPYPFIEKRNTEMGTLNISSAELTAADLITYVHEIGGFSRAATVLNELAEVLNFSKCTKKYFEHVSMSTIQRLGYVLDVELGYTELAEKLYRKAIKQDTSMRKIALNRRKPIAEHLTNEKWKIIVNIKIEIDD